MPLSAALYDRLHRQGFYAKNPGQEIAVAQLSRKAPTRDSEGLRVAGLRKIRGIIDEELESVFDGRKNPIEALNAAVDRGNALLKASAHRE